MVKKQIVLRMAMLADAEGWILPPIKKAERILRPALTRDEDGKK